MVTKRTRILLVILLLVTLYYAWQAAHYPSLFQFTHLNFLSYPRRLPLTVSEKETLHRPTGVSPLMALIDQYQLGKMDPFSGTNPMGPSQPSFLSETENGNENESESNTETDSEQPALKAILEGEKNMAMIAYQGEDQLVRKGDTLGSYQVAQVSAETVTLTSSHGKLILTLTQETDED